MHPQIRTHRADREVTRLAEAQHGVLARSQMEMLGLSKTQIRTRIQRGTLVRLHRGVYAVGHRRLHRDGFWLAAVLASGRGAALSHRDAAALHELRPASGERIDVTTPSDTRSTARIRIHPRRPLHPDDVTTIDAIPVTRVARTLVDLADVLPRDALARTLATADRRLLLDVRELDAALLRVHGRRGPGQAKLRAVLAEHARHGTPLTRSALEDRFLRLAKDADLPRPATNVWIEGVEVDAAWREQRVVVELDSWAFHGDRAAFRRDRAKGNRLELAGWRLLRYTHVDVVHDRGRVVEELRTALGAGVPAPRRTQAPG